MGLAPSVILTPYPLKVVNTLMITFSNQSLIAFALSLFISTSGSSPKSSSDSSPSYSSSSSFSSSRLVSSLISEKYSPSFKALIKFSGKQISSFLGVLVISANCSFVHLV